MDKQTIFKDLARYYDLIYFDKDYRKEAATVTRLVRQYKTSPGNDLLEIGCGTGGHALYLKDVFRVVATDAQSDMLKVARSKVKGVTFKQADMIDFDLGRQFDVVLCLFSSIGYVRTYPNLKRTLRNFARHLKPGGVAIIEPWYTKSAFNAGRPGMSGYSGGDVKIGRMWVLKERGSISILDMHYLIAEQGGDVKHYVDRHELGLFDRATTLRYMRQAGLRPKFLKQDLSPQRGVYIGVRT
jgi:SAM-dependent methyltransferase